MMMIIKLTERLLPLLLLRPRLRTNAYFDTKVEADAEAGIWVHSPLAARSANKLSLTGWRLLRQRYHH